MEFPILHPKSWKEIICWKTEEVSVNCQKGGRHQVLSLAWASLGTEANDWLEVQENLVG